MKNRFEGYEGYIIKNKKKTKKGFFKLILIVFTIVLVFLGTMKFDFSEKLKNLGKKQIVAEKIYYYLSFGEYDDFESATTNAQLVKDMGGVGYVVLNDTKYHIVISSYLEMNECIAVKERLFEKKIDSKILEIKCKSIYGQKNSTIYKNKEAVTLYNNLIEDIYEIFVQSSKETSILSKQKINDLYSKYNSKINKFIKIEDYSKEFLNLKVHLNFVKNVLGNLENLDDGNLNVGLQYNLILLIQDYQYLSSK